MIPSVVARLERAESLAADLYSRCSAWSVNHPPVIVVEQDDDGLATWFADTDAEPPIDLAVTAGEIAYHLRACLDHTIWALVESAGVKPGRDTQFPIEVKPKSRTAALKGVPLAAQQIIRDVQADGSQLAQALAVVHAMSNVDKHRSLYAAQATAVVAEASVRDLHFDAVRANKPTFADPVYLSPGERNWILKWLLSEDADLVDLANRTEVSWQHDVKFYVRWESLEVGWPSKGFSRIISEVRDLLVMFDPFFGRTS